MSLFEKKDMPWKWIGLGVIILTVFVSWFFLPVNEWLRSFSQWIKNLGTLGVVLFAAVYIFATIVLAPGSPFTMAAGLAFGGGGFPLVLVSATIGASLAFLVARYLMRDRVNKAAQDRPTFKAVEKAVTSEGWKIAMLLRLSPVVPFNLQNYLFGVTDIPFWHYVAATSIGIIPGTALYVYLGVMGQAAGGGGSGGPLKWVFFGVRLVATLIVTVIVTKNAKAKLKEFGLEDSKEK